MQVKYPVDPAHMRPGEGRLFTKYLSQQSLHIDVWDGDSLLLIGSCIVELKVQLLSFTSIMSVTLYNIFTLVRIVVNFNDLSLSLLQISFGL